MVDQFLWHAIRHLGFNLETVLAVVGVVSTSTGAIWWQFRERRIKVSTIVLLPTLMVAALAWVVIAERRSGAWLAAAVIVGLGSGCGVGAVRAKLVETRIDPTSRMIVVRGTPMSALFWLGVLIAKSPFRFAAQRPGAHSSILAGCLSAAFLAIGLGAVAASRLLWYSRYRQATDISPEAGS